MYKLIKIIAWCVFILFIFTPPNYKQYQGPTTFTSIYSAVRITPPDWINSEYYGELDNVVNRYIQTYETYANKEIRKEGLWIIIAPSQNFVSPFMGDELLVGLFRVRFQKAIQFRFNNQNLDIVPRFESERIITLTWRFENGQPRKLNPLHSFIHELIHANQWEETGTIHHNFTQKEKEISTDKYTKYIVFNDTVDVCSK